MLRTSLRLLRAIVATRLRLILRTLRLRKLRALRLRRLRSVLARRRIGRARRIGMLILGLRVWARRRARRCEGGAAAPRAKRHHGMKKTLSRGKRARLKVHVREMKPSTPRIG